MPDVHEPVVLLSTSAYVAVSQAARQAIENPDGLPVLLAALEVMETIRTESWLEDADKAVLANRKMFHSSFAGDGNGYFPSHAS